MVVDVSRMGTEEKDPSAPFLSNLVECKAAVAVFPTPPVVSGKGVR